MLLLVTVLVIMREGEVLALSTRCAADEKPLILTDA